MLQSWHEKCSGFEQTQMQQTRPSDHRSVPCEPLFCLILLISVFFGHYNLLIHHVSPLRYLYKREISNVRPFNSGQLYQNKLSNVIVILEKFAVQCYTKDKQIFNLNSHERNQC
jgi:hypothetical protein